MKEYKYMCKDGRERVVIVDDNGKHTTKSYPRILMEKKIGRPLEPYEDVHHIDENPCNNSLDNLEIKIHGEHQREHSQYYKDTEEICMICGNKYIMTAKQWRKLSGNVLRCTGNRHGWLTCSKSCAAKAGSGKYTPLYDFDKYVSTLDWWKRTTK